METHIARTHLGGTGQSVPAIGLGCAGMSNSYGPADEVESFVTMHTALDHGIDFFDTSDLYGGGHNETLIGRFIRHVGRSRVLIGTKFGSLRGANGLPGGVDNRPEYIRSACDASLQRLGIDVIDLYYMHRRDPAMPIEESVGAMSRLVEAGKVRWLGLSEVAPTTLRQAHAVHPIAALQSEYSLWMREPEDEVLGTCRELGISFVPFCPLGRAFLTGTLETEVFAPTDLRSSLPRFNGEAAAQNRRLVERLAVFAEQRGVAPAQVALAWLLSKSDERTSIVPIPGTKQPRHLAQNAAATRLRLPANDIAELETLFARDAVAGARYSAHEAARAGT